MKHKNEKRIVQAKMKILECAIRRLAVRVSFMSQYSIVY